MARMKVVAFAKIAKTTPTELTVKNADRIITDQLGYQLHQEMPADVRMLFILH